MGKAHPRRPKILVIDDDPTIRELLFVNLERRGFSVAVVGDSRFALAAVSSGQPDLVILDVMMPDVDGWEICKMIRDDRRLDTVRILMLTARGTPRDRMIGKEILK